MNLQCLLRKRALGIEHLDDYIRWAIVQCHLGVAGKNVVALSEMDFFLESIHKDETKIEMARKLDLALDDIGQSFPEMTQTEPPHAASIQSIYFDSLKSDLQFYMIDIRPIHEVYEGSDIFMCLNAMAEQCGCQSIDKHWTEFEPELGERTLCGAFTSGILGSIVINMCEEKATELANRFTAHFSESVRYFSNFTDYPWSKQGCYSTRLQSTNDSDSDFSLILYDGEKIGMIVLTYDY